VWLLPNPPTRPPNLVRRFPATGLIRESLITVAFIVCASGVVSFVGWAVSTQDREREKACGSTLASFKTARNGKPLALTPEYKTRAQGCAAYLALKH
jgi:hypothetical protein